MDKNHKPTIQDLSSKVIAEGDQLSCNEYFARKIVPGEGVYIYTGFG